MRKLFLFLHINSKVLTGFIVGGFLGYLHWFYFGCYWGTYLLSAECWVNCSMGAIFGGFVASLFNNNDI